MTPPSLNKRMFLACKPFLFVPELVGGAYEVGTELALGERHPLESRNSDEYLGGIMGVNTAINLKLDEKQNCWWRDLPFQYESVRVYQDQRPQGFRFSPFTINIEATLLGKSLLVCGEAETREMATAKAISELIERSSLISIAEYLEEIETSNGWAAHPDESIANSNAIHELVERDAVLKHWYSSTPFFRITPSSFPQKLKNWIENELQQSEFPNLTLLISHLGFGPSVTCLLTNQQGYGVCGHSTKEDLSSAVDAAIAEACRSAHHSIRKSFFSDTVLLRNGVSGFRVNPGAHGVYYSYQEPFPAWLNGQNMSWESAEENWKDHSVRLTALFPTFRLEKTLDHPVFVTFAKHHGCLPLSWGPTSENLLSILKSKMPLGKLLQGRKINMKPHIVA